MIVSFADIFWAVLLPAVTFILYEASLFRRKKVHVERETASVSSDVTTSNLVDKSKEEKKSNLKSVDECDLLLDAKNFAASTRPHDPQQKMQVVKDSTPSAQLKENASEGREESRGEKNTPISKSESICSPLCSLAGSICDEILNIGKNASPCNAKPANPLYGSTEEANEDLHKAESLPSNGGDVLSSVALPSSTVAFPCGVSLLSPSSLHSSTIRFCRPTIVVAYASHTRSALSLAHRLLNSLQNELHENKSFVSSSSSSEDVMKSKSIIPDVKVMEINEEDALGFSFTSLLEEKFIVLTIFIVSTFTDGRAPPNSQSFELLLQDAYQDHRVSRDVLSGRRFALLGLGDIAYGDQYFNRFAKNVCAWCKGLGAPPFIVPPIHATERVQEALFQRFTHSVLLWLQRASFTPEGHVTSAIDAKKKNSKGEKNRKEKKYRLKRASQDPGSEGSRPTSVGPHGGDAGIGEDREEMRRNDSFSSSSMSTSSFSDSEMEDVEDIVPYDSLSAQGRGLSHSNTDDRGQDMELPELLHPSLRKNLTKQGYQLIGSHSGVKLCRWTKSMLRGRGGCYKHTFYNINSSQCMEMTPSLACANKCIFCWRHHTNPVSRNFRWKQDPPEFLIENGMKLHYQMVKQMRGVPGVTPERLADAMHIRHCALSLVGEPIMYPQINGFCQLLHQRHISSFMVTNAQFPEQLRDLQPVVQLYLSIDAATPEELKRIDRPLFEDYWERCLECVRELRQKKQRTVFRLTLVNEYNAGNIASYADLVMQGWPDFIEVKGVTYCGTSNGSTLKMSANVPRHDEVIRFCTDLCEELARRHPHYVSAIGKSECLTFLTEEEKHRPYNIACEHEHSCCVLISLDKFFINGVWHTWIDYERFFTLVEEGRTDFTSVDYCAPTPLWAVYRSPEAGFDPQHVRVTKTGKPRPTAPITTEGLKEVSIVESTVL